MGSSIKLNDTLQITTKQGFPEHILNLKDHEKGLIKLKDMEEKVFAFNSKEGARIYHPAPTRCFLVHNIQGKWLYWGKIMMVEQTITEHNGQNSTSGKYKIIKIYDLKHQKDMSLHEVPEGCNFFKI